MQAVKSTPIAAAADETGVQIIEAAGWQVAGAATPADMNRAHLYLADESHYGKLLIDGRDGHLALAAFGLPSPETVGSGVRDAGWSAYRLRADRIFIASPPGEEAVALARLATVVSDNSLITFTDVTHGRAQLRLTGPAASELLGRLCALDFRPEHFPDNTARQTSVAGTRQLIIRHDMASTWPSYLIIGARSLGAYLWQTILHAGRDFQLQVIGPEDLPTGGGR